VSETITVAGVTFTADQVKSCVVTVDGREITISEKREAQKMGFQSKEN